MVQELDDIEMLTFFRLLAFTGMRKNEVGALRWTDIDLESGQLKVNQTLAKGENNKIIFQTPKTKKSQRTISLDPKTIDILKDWHKYSTKGLLFKNESGSPKSIVHVNNLLNRVWRKYPNFQAYHSSRLQTYSLFPIVRGWSNDQRGPGTTRT